MASVRARSQVQPATGPAWDIARLFSDQGDLSESEYLFLTDHTSRLAEYSDGHIEVLPTPTTEHQEIVLFLVNLLRSFVTPKRLGRALMAPLRIKLRSSRFREPDVIFMLEQHAATVGNRFWDGADLVMEVVSEDEPQRDTVEKRRDYAEAGIPEYWIVDPRHRSITVLRLDGQQYVVHGEFGAGSRATSALLEGFAADVNAVFAAAQAAR